MELEFVGAVFEWRGPSPFHFVRVPEPECEHLALTASAVTYGWGMVPVTATVGETEWTTSLYPKDGGYLLPVKDLVRRAEQLGPGDEVHVTLVVAV